MIDIKANTGNGFSQFEHHFCPLSHKKTLDKSFSAEKNVVYIINGEPYTPEDSLELDSVLRHYTVTDISEVSILKGDEGIIDHPRNDVILINFAYQQSQKEINAKLKELKNKFTDKYYGFSQHIPPNSKNPVLLINNKLVYPSVATDSIQKLQPNKIIYIEVNYKPQDSKIYGQNAKNGLVKIWTKKQ